MSQKYQPQLHDPVSVGPYAVPLPPPPAAPPPEAGVEPAEPDQPKDYFRPDIEGLRAVAVLAVLLFHVGLPIFAGGFVGVDVFYVISGFLITGLLLREGERSGKVDLVRFYARRMRRLLPAALLVIVVTMALSAVILSPLRLPEVAGDAAASALYVSNYRFAIEATDYLAVGAPSPFLHYWTLGVEEQFYLLWPLLLLVFVRFLSPRLLGLAVVVVAALSFGLSLYWTDALPSWAFFSLPTRAWELAAGALIAVGLVRLPSRTPTWLAGGFVWLGLALIVAAVVLLGDTTPYPGLAALLPVVGSVLIIVGGISRVTLPGRLLSNPVATYLGRISYSLYLWHWPILVLVPIALGIDSVLLNLVLAWFAIIIAAVSTELIEQPFRHGTFLARRPNGTVRLGLLTSVAVAAGALVLGGAVAIPNPFFKPDPVVVQLTGVRDDLPRSYADGCHLEFEATEPTDCAYGAVNASKTAYLFGDSHAEQWLPALEVIARQKGWRLVSDTKAACSPLDVPLWERKLRRTYDECQRWRQAVMAEIEQARPEIVFMGSSRDYELWNGSGVDRVVDILPQWEGKMTDRLRQLRQSAKRVVLLGETPFLNFDPVDCLAQLDKVTSCDAARQLAVDDVYGDVERRAAAKGGAQILNINALLCSARTCRVMDDGVVMYRDQHHLTATYMASLAGAISEYLAGRDPLASPAPGGSAEASGKPGTSAPA